MKQLVHPWILGMNLVEEARLGSGVRTPTNSISQQDFPLQGLVPSSIQLLGPETWALSLTFLPNARVLIGHQPCTYFLNISWVHFFPVASAPYQQLTSSYLDWCSTPLPGLSLSTSGSVPSLPSIPTCRMGISSRNVHMTSSCQFMLEFSSTMTASREELKLISLPDKTSGFAPASFHGGGGGAQNHLWIQWLTRRSHRM